MIDDGDFRVGISFERASGTYSAACVVDEQPVSVAGFLTITSCLDALGRGIAEALRARPADPHADTMPPADPREYVP